MGRYAFTYEVDGKCVLYAESTSDEDKLDLDFEDLSERDGKHLGCIAVDWTGNGWLAFWRRCMDMVIDWSQKHGWKDGMCHACDLWYDKERSW